MGFNPPVPQQDSNWEIRVAVQLSLLFQIILIFVGPMRKRSSHPIPRFFVWSCYLLADWVADLALGLLLNNMGNIGGGGNPTSSFGLKRGGGGANAGASAGNNNASSSGPIIFAFWTPFLLLHLGGPDTITAYSLEDNELWLRHLIGLLFELFSASVIFFCSLRGNPVIAATVLMFIVGIIKYGERTYSLYSGSVDGFRANILDPPDPGPNYAKLMTEFDAKEKAGLVVEITIANGMAEEAQKNMAQEETKRLVVNTEKSVEARAYEFFLIFRRLFVNLILSFKERRLSQAFFLQDLKAIQAFDVIEVELNFIYDMVYTKAPVAHTRAGWVLRFVCSGCLVSALVIFFLLDKGRAKIERTDVGITYALLLGGLALDATALLTLLFSNRVTVFLEQSRQFKWLGRLTRSVKRWRRRRWSGKTSQLNLIGYCLGRTDKYNKDGRWLKVADKLGIAEIVVDIIFVRRVPLAVADHKEGEEPSLRKFVFEGLKFVRRVKIKEGEEASLLKFIFDGLKEAAQNLEGTDGSKNSKEVCNYRGEDVINKHAAEIKKKALGDDDKWKVILESVEKRDFDESLLIWHVATDLCLAKDDKHPVVPSSETVKRSRYIGETLSEYMLYLLIKQPEMLSATAGIGLLRYRDTCAEAWRFFGSMSKWIHSQEDARKMLLSVNTTEKPSLVKGDRSKSVLFDACILAKALRKLDEELMWKVVTGVWREMLTYAAGKCRGSTHVRQLSRGGELITLVWFLMAHMGLGDMYQIQEGDAKAKLIVIDQ